MKRSLLWLTSTLTLLAGCSDAHKPFDEGEQPDPVPNVGDETERGKVTNVQDLGEGCMAVTYEVPPAWKCSDEQIVLAGGVVSDSDDGEQPDVDDALAASVALSTTSCGDLADLVRQSMRASNRWYAQSSYRQGLTSCLPTYPTTYYQDGEVTDWCGVMYASGPVPGSGGTTASGGSTSSNDDGASEYSTTNNQVAEVEEADYVKNDSGHVYVLDSTGLRVFDAWPAEETHQINRISLPGEPRRLLLAGDRLVVFSRVSASVTDPNYGYSTASPSQQGCTYGYQCRASSEGGQTIVQVYDVSAPESPSLLTQYDLKGAYVASRRIDDDVYMVIEYASDSRPLPDVDFDVQEGSPAKVKARYEALLDTIDAKIDAIPDSALLPDARGGQTGEAGCQDALVAAAANGASMLSVLSFDLTALNQPRQTFIASKPGFVYASADALYVATDGVTGSDAYGYYSAPNQDVSSIHKFSLDAGTPRYVGSAVVRGHVLNQFSMDENAGVLRVAATSGWVPDPDVSSTITTLGETEQGFKRLGELAGLAPTEDIRSVRFDGERGFVVTFKKTDPLFVIGLADPAKPKLLGELKIPGFSTYMHPLDQDHLLSVGFDADDHGDFAFFDGIQIQIFDVSNLAAPALLHKTTIGTRGSSSEALMNHLAFNYFAPKGMLAMPITVCEGGDDGVYGTEMSFSGIIAYDVSLETGITEHGRMPFADSTKTYDYSYYGGDCMQWWASSTSNVKRSIFFDDYLVGLSDSELRVGQLDALSTPLVTLPLTDGSTEPMPVY